MVTLASERKILLSGREGHRWQEVTLGTAATPGMAVEMQADGDFDQPASTKAECVKKQLPILEEDANQGNIKTVAFTSGNKAIALWLLPGDHFLAFVKSGENIAVGDVLVVEGGGSGLWIEAAGTEARYTAEAVESSDGALTANGHIKCRYLG